MKEYLSLLQRVLDNGVISKNRTGVNTLSVFIEHLKIDISEYFPLITTKKIHFKSIVYEMLWFLRNDSNIKFLKENGVRIWDEWADKNGNLGLTYGNMWREFPGTIGSLDERSEEYFSVDQIKNVIDQIKNNPDSRRHIVTAWHPGIISEFALPPCHCFFQFLVRDKDLSCNLYMRKLAAPFNREVNR